MFKGIFRRHGAGQFQSSALPGPAGFAHDFEGNDTPVFQLGLAGFNPAERTRIEAIVKLLPPTSLKWRVGDFETADALFVCGNNTRNSAAHPSHNENILRVLAGSALEKPILLSLPNIDRPLAFSLPVTQADIEPAFGFHAASPASVRIVLENFENCLQAKLAQYIIGKQLMRRERELQAGAYHVLHLGKLLAVVNLLHFQIGLLAEVNPRLLDAAIWEKRPTLASAIPQHFLHSSVANVRWVYAQYSQRDLLPGRYRHKTIYYRQRPQVVLSWLTDPQLEVMHELGSKPATATQLVERLGMRPEQLARDLTCLYFAVSITTTASMATIANIDRQPRQPVEYLSSYVLGTGSAPPPPRIFDSSIAQEANLANAQHTTVAAKLQP